MAKPNLARFGLAFFVLLSAGATAVEAAFVFGPERLFARFNPPADHVSLKSENLTANLVGEIEILGRLADKIQFRANERDWRHFKKNSPRLRRRDILLELPADQLVAGENRVEVVFESHLGAKRTMTFDFRYDPEPEHRPIAWNWSNDSPEVQDGAWQRVETDKGWRLRPVPGTEAYDRLVLVSQPFEGPRRVSFDVTFRRNTGTPFGFGVVPLWGGHNDRDAISPRRGWEIGIAWYYSLGGGFGVEFSQKDGPEAHRTVSEYAEASVAPDETYRIVAETRVLTDAHGAARNYSMRMQWSHPASGQVSNWIELTDAEVPMTRKPYAVALVAHRAAVEFGTVLVEELGTE